MKISLTRRAVAAGAAAFSLQGGGMARAQAGGIGRDAFDAWLAVLPLIEMAGARERLAHPVPGGPEMPCNRLQHSPALAGPQSRSITAPNRDTIYSSAFIDLTQGPLTVRLPESGARYLSVAVMDMYTNVDVVLGARTTGGHAGTWRLIGPADTPRDERDRRLSTAHGWLLVRILADGEHDLAEAQRLQKAVALSGPEIWHNRRYATRAADWTAYFRSAQSLLESDAPTYKAGLDAYERLRRAGKAGDFARSGYTDADARAIDAGIAAAQQLVRGSGGKRSFTDGWSYPTAELGLFGDNYLMRAIVAVGGLAALPIKEAMYMRPAGDGEGLFHGDGLYRFSLKKPVPVRAFWSLTMYEATPEGHFYFTPNALGRYALGDRTTGLVRNADGSLDIWIGRRDPGGARTSNWLPAPKSGPYALTLRAYLPDRDLLEGRYRLPPIVAAN